MPYYILLDSVKTFFQKLFKTFLLVEEEIQKLSEKKNRLMENVVSIVKELQEAHAAAAAQPGSISGMYTVK